MRTLGHHDEAATPAHVAHQLAREAALAAARLSFEQDHAAASGERGSPELTQPLNLAIAADHVEFERRVDRQVVLPERDSEPRLGQRVQRRDPVEIG